MLSPNSKFNASINREVFDVEKLSTSFEMSDINRFGLKERMWRDEVKRRAITEFSVMLAVGRQSKVKEETETIKTFIARIPKSPRDWIKKLVVEFEPTLNFGWLTPEMISKEVPVKQRITQTYYNIYPIPRDEIPTYMGSWPSHIEWLTSEPATDEDLKDAKKSVREQARENAMYMAISQIHPR